MKNRSVQGVIPALRTEEGAGFVVHRPFPTQQLMQFDPFLLLDEMGPYDAAPGEAKGAPDHPHRGFETVTYLLSGEMEHADSSGHRGMLGPGDVQWMTAGAGVVHSEMPSSGFQKRGGRMHGFQIWVNLPAKSKMMAPRYQEIPASRIPLFESSGGKVTARVIAGQVGNSHAVIDTVTPIQLIHFKLAPDAEFSQPVPAEYNAMAYVVGGSGSFDGGSSVARSMMVAFSGDGEAVSFRAGDEGLELLLLAGLPIGEPVARYGPFVMNTREEIHQAVEDFRSGRLGQIKRQS